MSASRSSRRCLDPALTWRERLLVLPILAVAVVFPGWNAGGITVWADWVYLGLGAAGMVALLLPMPGRERERQWRLRPADNLMRLLRFPVFWLGLLFFFYLMLSLSNYWAVFHSNGLVWWLVSVEPIGWLPSSIEAPYGAHNSLRLMVQWSGPFLLVCVAWVGLVRSRVVTGLLLLAMLNAVAFTVVALLQQISDTRMILGLVPYGPNLTPYGTFINANAAAMFLYLHLALALGMTLSFVRRTQAGADNFAGLIYSVICATVIAVGLVGSLSRGALLFGGLIIGAFILAALLRLKNGTPSERKRLFVLIAGGVLATSTALAFFFQRDTEKLESEAASLVSALRNPAEEVRLKIIGTCLQMYLEKPWLGWGANSFRFAYPEFQRTSPALVDEEGNITSHFDYAHTDWLQVPIEFGLLGALPLLLMLLWWLFQAVRYRYNFSSANGFMLFGAALAFAHAAFDFVFYNPPILMVFAFWVSLAVRQLLLLERRSKR
ncbi:MAG: O-antigen ligase family protein [Opitutales bacterium]